MSRYLSAVKVTDRVHWVGAVDWALADFHGYKTERGSTYNAYLILGDKITLVDTVKAPFKAELLERVASVVDPCRVDYIISHHAEMDHSGALPDLIRELKPEKVFASPKGVEALNDHFRIGGALTEVKDGETLDLGGAKLSFFETRMLHWPDSMMSYLHGDGILFSQDGFGMHLATAERFDDELPTDLLEQEALKYYANILLPYSHLVKKAVERLGGAGLDIRMIAPDHGPVWRKDIGGILGRYLEWSEQKPRRKAVVVYDTMWQSTERMARAVAEGLMAGGVSPKVMPLASNHRSEVVPEVLTAGALLLGSPTMNNQVYPTIADCVTYLKGLKPKNLIGAAFGSFGWSGESVKLLEKELDEMKVTRAAESVSVRYVPKSEDLAKCHELGAQVAARLVEICGG